MKDFWRELVYHVRAWLILSIEAFKLRLAIMLADIKQKARNRRFFVVLLATGIDKKGKPVFKLRSVDNEDIKTYKRMGWLPRRMTTLEVDQKCFYATPLSRNNTGSREERQKAMDKYLRYQKTINNLRF